VGDSDVPMFSGHVVTTARSVIMLYEQSGTADKGRNSSEVTLISGFCHDVDEICALLGCYAASCGNCLSIRCTETLVNNYHTTPRNIPEECRSLQRGSSVGVTSLIRK
jgi:hypothetical protein